MKRTYVTTTSKQAQEIQNFPFFVLPLTSVNRCKGSLRTIQLKQKVTEKFVRHVGIWDTDAHEGFLWTCEHFS